MAYVKNSEEALAKLVLGFLRATMRLFLHVLEKLQTGFNGCDCNKLPTPG